MNLFELFVKIGVKDEASKNVEGISSKLGKGLKTAAKVGTAAVGAAAAGITALTTAAVNSFAEYEQLAGGAQKIFNQMDYSKIANDANNAYKELGLSANQYLAVINDVGATFAATMGDEAGYEAAKTGLKAISDYASGTGKNVDELSQKFTLITRSTSSYQSIADQFSGILPATSAGFLKQAQAAGVLSDKYTQLTQVPIDEYQAAVSKMLQQGVSDLGLANNTMDEAFSTLSGSLTMAKTSWNNLVTGLADDTADLDMLIGNFVESVGAVATNLIPKIGTALNGASKLVRDLIPEIVQEIPKLINDNLPILAEAAISIIQSLVDGISENQEMLMETAFETIVFLANSLISMLPEIVALGLDLIVSLANGITESLPKLVPTIIDVVLKIAETLTEPSTLVSLTKSALRMIIALAEGLVKALPNLLEQAPVIIQNLVNSLIEMLPEIIAFAITLIQVLTETLLTPKNIALLINSAIDIVEALIKGLAEMLPQIVLSGMDLVTGVIDGIKSMFSNLKNTGKDAFNSVKDGIKDKISDAKTWGKDLIDNFVSGITEKWTKLKESVKNLAQTVKDYIGFSEPKKGPLSNFHTYAPDMIDLFVKGLRENDYKIQNQLSDSLDFDGGYIGSFGGVDLNGADGYVSRDINIVQNIYSQAKTAAELMREARWQAKMEVLTSV